MIPFDGTPLAAQTAPDRRVRRDRLHLRLDCGALPARSARDRRRAGGAARRGRRLDVGVRRRCAERGDHDRRQRRATARPRPATASGHRRRRRVERSDARDPRRVLRSTPARRATRPAERAQGQGPGAECRVPPHRQAPSRRRPRASDRRRGRRRRAHRPPRRRASPQPTSPIPRSEASRRSCASTTGRAS